MREIAERKLQEALEALDHITFSMPIAAAMTYVTQARERIEEAIEKLNEGISPAEWEAYLLQQEGRE